MIGRLSLQFLNGLFRKCACYVTPKVGFDGDFIIHPIHIITYLSQDRTIYTLRKFKKDQGKISCLEFLASGNLLLNDIFFLFF